MDRLRTQALIIGGGVTGTGLARDLALRGIACILVETGDINAGASGRNHGLLHSGARYVATDPEAARECHVENAILKRVAPHCIEDTGGLFVAVEGDDESYIADFPERCRRCGIPCEPLDLKEAAALEPALSSTMIAAYRVDDAAIDPFKISLENLAQSLKLGSRFLRHTRVTGFEIRNHRIQTARLENVTTGSVTTVEAEAVINAAGAWAADVAYLGGMDIEMLYSKGTLLVTGHRVTDHVINRLRKPGDGDILVPGGTVSILGTTSLRVDSPDQTNPSIEEVDMMVSEGARMIPSLDGIRYIRAYAGIRPLLKTDLNLDDRSVSRGFTLLDHTQDGLNNFTTLPAGKLTTFRFMAEKTADWVCERMGHQVPCRTRTEPLPSTEAGQWTTPGAGPRLWLQETGPARNPLCECEILPKGLVDRVIREIQTQGLQPDLTGISLRSRVGRGPCQGTFCGQRITGHLYERGIVTGKGGIEGLREFLNERWRGERPVLWDGQIIQAELKEAIYCGLSGLEDSNRVSMSPHGQ